MDAGTLQSPIMGKQVKVKALRKDEAVQKLVSPKKMHRHLLCILMTVLLILCVTGKLSSEATVGFIYPNCSLNMAQDGMGTLS